MEIKRALAFVTSAYSSYSSCRQYLENIGAAQKEAGSEAPRVEKIRAFYNHPEFIRANVEHIQEALANVPKERQPSVHLVFTAHSIPVSMAQHCDYVEQLKETSRLIAEALAIENSQLTFQSRSGSPRDPWLGPDVCDYLRELKAGGASDVVVAPIGFVSDHMEIIYDLDVEARRLCEQIGLNMFRARTAGTHPSFVAMIRRADTGTNGSESRTADFWAHVNRYPKRVGQIVVYTGGTPIRAAANDMWIKLTEHPGGKAASNSGEADGTKAAQVKRAQLARTMGQCDKFSCGQRQQTSSRTESHSPKGRGLLALEWFQR